MSLMFFLLYRIFAVNSISESGNAQYAFFGTKALFVVVVVVGNALYDTLFKVILVQFCTCKEQL